MAIDDEIRKVVGDKEQLKIFQVWSGSLNDALVQRRELLHDKYVKYLAPIHDERVKFITGLAEELKYEVHGMQYMWSGHVPGSSTSGQGFFSFGTLKNTEHDKEDVYVTFDVSGVSLEPSSKYNKIFTVEPRKAVSDFFEYPESIKELKQGIVEIIKKYEEMYSSIRDAVAKDSNVRQIGNYLIRQQ